jgi:hypothetical protein
VHPRRVFLLAFAAFFLVSAAWALALPVNGTYDEKHHIVRAYSVASGQWFSNGHATEDTHLGTEAFNAPASLLPSHVDCFWFTGRGPASCQGPAGGPEKIPTVSTAARYSPVYYLPVGLPLLLSPDHTGIVLSRLVSALLSALLLAAAAATAARLGSRMLLAAVALVSTPMVLNLSGSLNPNGLEIAAGVLLFAAMSALLQGARERWLVIAAGVAAALLLTVRQMGPLLFLVDVAGCLLLAGRARTAALWRDRSARLILGAFVLAGLVTEAAWALASPINVTALPTRAVSGDIAHKIVADRVPFYLHQVVGQFGYGETTISPYAIYFWYLLWLAVVVPALIWGGWRLRLVLVGLAVFSFAVLVALDLRYAPLSGWFAQGRYALPTAVGIVALAALARPSQRARPAMTAVIRSRWYVVVLVTATVPVHLYALARVMTRYQSGLDASLNPFAGSWRPVGGPAVPLLVAAVGLAMLTVVSLVTPGSALASPGTVSGELDNGCVTPFGQSASRVTKASTTDATSH